VVAAKDIPKTAAHRVETTPIFFRLNIAILPLFLGAPLGHLVDEIW
jgi:hypothetical protein